MAAFFQKLVSFGAGTATDDSTSDRTTDQPDAADQNNILLERRVREQFRDVVERTKMPPPEEVESAIGNEKSHLENNLYRFGLVSLISIKAFGKFDERFIKDVLQTTERTDDLWNTYYPRFKDAYELHHPQEPGVGLPLSYKAKYAYHHLCSKYLIGTFEAFAKSASKTLVENIINPVDQTLREDQVDLEPYLCKLIDILNDHYHHYNTGQDNERIRDEKKIYRDFSKKLINFLPEIAPFHIFRQSSYFLLKVVGYLFFWLDIPAAYTIRLILKYLLLPYWILPKAVESLLELHGRTPALLADPLLKVVTDQLTNLLAATETPDAIEDEGTVFAFGEAAWNPVTMHKLRALLRNMEAFSNLFAPELENSLKLITKKMLQHGLLNSLKSINTALRTISPDSQVDRTALTNRISRILASLAKEKTQGAIYESLTKTLDGKAALNTNTKIDAIQAGLIEKLQNLPEENLEPYVDEAFKWYLAELRLMDLKTLDEEHVEMIKFFITALQGPHDQEQLHDKVHEFLETSEKYTSAVSAYDDDDALKPCEARAKAVGSLSRRISRGMGYQNNDGFFSGRAHALSGTIASMAIETLDNSVGLVTVLTEELSQRKIEELVGDLMNPAHTRSLIFSTMNVLS